MKVDFTKPLHNLEGTVLEQENVPLTLKIIIVRCFLMQQEGTTAEKLAYYELAKKIHEADGEVDITLDEAKMIQDKIGEQYTPIVIGRLNEVLN